MWGHIITFIGATELLCVQGELSRELLDVEDLDLEEEQ